MPSGIRSDLSLRSPVRGEGWGGCSLVVFRATPASAAPFDCCTPLLLGHIRAGRRRHRYAIAGKMPLRLSQDSQSILLYRARLFPENAARSRGRHQSPPQNSNARHLAGRCKLKEDRGSISTMPTMLMPLIAIAIWPSRVGIMWRTMPPPLGICQVWNFSVLGSNRTRLFGRVFDSTYQILSSITVIP